MVGELKNPLESKKPDEQKKKSKTPLIIALILGIGVGLSFLYVSYPLKQPFQNIDTSSNPTPGQNLTEQPSNETHITYSGKILLSEEVYSNGTWTKILKIPSGKWLQVIMDFGASANLHIYDGSNESLTEVQTGDEFVKYWERKFWTRNGLQEYSIVIRTPYPAYGNFTLVEIGSV